MKKKLIYPETSYDYAKIGITATLIVAATAYVTASLISLLA